MKSVDALIQDNKSQRINGLSIIYNLIEDLKQKIHESESNDYKQFLKIIISELYQSYDSITFLTKYDFWVFIEQKMLEYTKNDPKISGFVIAYRIKREGNKFVQITLNPEL